MAMERYDVHGVKVYQLNICERSEITISAQASRR
jgi:hypothetical protein